MSNYDSNYLNHPNSIKIEVIDLELNTVTNYASIRAASRVLDINHNTIRGENILNGIKKALIKVDIYLKKLCKEVVMEMDYI